MNILDLHATALSEAVRLVEGTRADQMGSTTPCEGWTVRQLIGHLAGSNRRWAKRAAGESVPPSVSADEPVEDTKVFRATADLVKEAWREPGRVDAAYPSPAGDVSGEMVVRGHITEVATHGWDLARATGQRAAFSPEVVNAAWDFARSNMPVQRPPGFAFAPPPEEGRP